MNRSGLKWFVLSSVVWPASVSLFFLVFLCTPVFADQESDGHTKSPHEYGHKGKGYEGHGSSSHGKGYKGHGGGDYGRSYQSHGSRHDGHRYGAHSGPHQSASKFIDHVLKFKQAMAITAEQENKLKGISTAYKRTRIKMKAEVELSNLDLHELLKNEKASLSEIESKLKNVHALKADLYMASIKARREAKGVLSDEQRKRMKAVHERIKAYGSGSMSKGHPGGYKHHGKDKEKESY